MAFIISLVVAYLLGSLSSSSLLAKFAGMPDPRESGSGNPGATNVLRSGNKKQALFVLLGDMAKGFLAIMIALIFGVRGGSLGVIAIAATAGHMFPVFFGFKGGKGVATALGTLIVISLPSALISVIVWAAVLFFTRFVSLASMVALIAAVILTAVTGSASVTFFYLILAALVIWRHKDNIERLRKGNESKFDLSLIMGKKGNAKSSSASPAPEKAAEPAPASEEKPSDDKQD